MAADGQELQLFLTRRWWFGIMLTVWSTLFGSFGKLALKLAHNVEKKMSSLEDLQRRKKKRLRAKRHFALCFAFVAIGILNPCCEIAAYLFASQAMLVPFASLSIVWNAAFAPYLLGEKLTFRDMAGTFLIFCGCGVVAVAGNHRDQEFTFQFLMRRFCERDFIIYLACMFCALFSMAWIMIFRQDSRWWHRVACGCIGGVLGGNFFLVKCTTLLFELSVYDHSIWLDWRSYAIFAATIFCSLGGFILLNSALRQYPAVDIVPLYQCAIMIAGSSSALAFFQDWAGFKLWQCIVFPIGLALTMIGIPVLVRQGPPHSTSKSRLFFSHDHSPRSSCASEPELEDLWNQSPLDHSKEWNNKSPLASEQWNKNNSPLASKQDKHIIPVQHDVQGRRDYVIEHSSFQGYQA
eukprot:gb/GEZN01008907.1/.p1 GENE.gb/GEZN01008907.1/~~gb/GEZN01008907.1/.p1  ORF type:complete len:407 (-),score=46.41 gb/GEZN01008907.1/:2-1222(-)